jgi:flagellar export protein FliJ
MLCHRGSRGSGRPLPAITRHRSSCHMAYTFRFQALLKYRQYLLTQAQTGLASAMRHYEVVKTLLQKTTTERDHNVILFQEKQRSGIKASEYHFFPNYFVSLEQQLLQLESELRELTKEVEKAKEFLRQRERDLKMLEVTDEKDRAAFRQAQTKKEQNRLDERAVMSDYTKKVRLQTKHRGNIE